ncbi:hypothetical protein M427DRAFT_236173 [Gonapodya prolifera JEL478]|uniref:Uncharacterized protein n=1 Tax=Gonapodya prolifera (strain JEL478) TaxID=1344416 RepID=A0A139AMH0_GONPJ|nr:hypothetical protein M427DRAFT_236173 [Gonapodya prolifera JEL478]|eukprot:KXS17962.1 hypothetical protein M427DRAFT_236173 [Gonapodya prolifera JEL478]
MSDNNLEESLRKLRETIAASTAKLKDSPSIWQSGKAGSLKDHASLVLAKKNNSGSKVRTEDTSKFVEGKKMWAVPVDGVVRVPSPLPAMIKAHETFDEEASHESFLEALEDWRHGRRISEGTRGAFITEYEMATETNSNLDQVSLDLQNIGLRCSQPTTSSLSYLERLLLRSLRKKSNTCT